MDDVSHDSWLQATGQLLLILVQLEMFCKLLILLSELSCVLFCSLHATPHLRHTHTHTPHLGVNLHTPAPLLSDGAALL